MNSAEGCAFIMYNVLILLESASVKCQLVLAEVSGCVSC